MSSPANFPRLDTTHLNIPYRTSFPRDPDPDPLRTRWMAVFQIRRLQVARQVRYAWMPNVDFKQVSISLAASNDRPDEDRLCATDDPDAQSEQPSLHDLQIAAQTAINTLRQHCEEVESLVTAPAHAPKELRSTADRQRGFWIANYRMVKSNAASYPL
jgi:hypothetical protein